MLRRIVSRGLEDHILLIIGADPDRLWVTEDGERERKIIKAKGGEATTEEIESNLGSFGFEWSKSTLYRRLGVLRERDLVRQGHRSGVYIITGKGVEELERKNLELTGKGALNTYTGNQFMALFFADVEGGKVKRLDMYARFYNSGFIEELLENMRRTIKDVDFDESLKGDKSFIFGSRQDPEFQASLQMALLMAYAAPDERIRLLLKLGAPDDVIKLVYEAYKD